MTCEVHPAAVHKPEPRELEAHHPVVRHWQELWTPETSPYPGTYKAFGRAQTLWDARTIKVPPTCHRDVHFWIVAIMRSLAHSFGSEAHAITADDVVAATKAVGKAAQLRGSWALRELQWASESPLRFLAAGGPIAVLLRARAWGEA